MPSSALHHLRVTLVALVVVAAALAAGMPKKTFSISAGDAVASLKQFAAQAGQQLIYSGDAVRGVTTNAIQGNFEPREALELMIAGTKLAVTQDRTSGALAVTRDSDRNDVRAAPAPEGRRPETPASDVRSETVVLSPFEVISDDRGYFAANTTAGTRLNSRIVDLGAAISVINKEQMGDFAMLDINDIFAYEANTEGTGNYTDFSFDVYGAPVDNVQLDPNNANRIRGLGAANITLGNFETSGRVPIDPLNIDSVEISRGPNSSLFGIGSSSGTVNSVPASSNLRRNKSQVTFRADDTAGYRTTLDLNRVLKPGVFALRGSAAYQHDAFERKPSGVESVRLNGMAKYRPFAKTTLSASFSSYRMHGNRPNATSARDGISGWVAAGSPTWDPISRTAKLGGVAIPYTGNFPAQYFWERPNGLYSLLHVEQGGITFWTTGRSTLTTTPMTASTGTVLRAVAPLPLAGNPLQNQPLWGALVGGVQQYTPPLTDKRIYDWTSLNLAAPNRVRDDSGIATALLDQVLLDTPRHSLAFQAGWFRETNERYQFTPLSDTSQLQGVGVITVDVNERRLDGSSNPNFLRPYVAVGFPSEKTGLLARDTYRGQLVYKLDLRRESSRWRWLGLHELSGYAEYKHYADRTRNYVHAIVDQHPWLPAGVHHLQDNIVVGGLPPGGQASQSHYNFYLGDNVGYNVEYAPPSYDLGTYTMAYGNPTTGITREPVKLGLVTKGNSGSLTLLKSRGAILQSHLLQDRVITTVGWRRDERYSKSRAPFLFENDGVTLDPGSDRWADGDWNVGKGMTKTAGIVVKPLRWFSLYANTSDSFQPATPASDAYRRAVPDPTGEGKDYGLMMNLLGGKLFIRLNQYQIDQNNDRNGTATTILNRMLTIDFSWRPGQTAFKLQDIAGEWVRGQASSRGQTLTASQLNEQVAQIMQVPVGFLTEPTTGPAPVAVNKTVGRGREFEVHYNPTDFWTVKFNLAEQEAINGKVATEVTQWLEERLKVWNGIIDPNTGRPWFTERYNNANSASETLASGTTSQLQTARAVEGKSRPQIRKYRANLSTSFKLAGITEHPVFKRINVGGAARWEDRGAIGYYGVQKLPAIITEFDVNRPVWDSDHVYLDAFASFRTKLFSNRAGSTFQLNVRNLTEGGHLQPISANPNGSPAAYRLVDPRKFILTVTFDL